MTTEPANPAVEDCLRNQAGIRPVSRIMFCARCGHATGGGYGHCSMWCKKRQETRESHLCCLGSCSLDDNQPVDPIAPCHPAPGTYQEWARDLQARQPLPGPPASRVSAPEET